MLRPLLKDGSQAPEFRVIAIEETNDWSKEADGYKQAMQLAGGKIYGIYLYDIHRVVHAAELTGSYELYRVNTAGNVLDEGSNGTDEQLEWLCEWLSTPEHEDVIYVHCGQIDRTPFPSDPHKLSWNFAEKSAEDLAEMTWEEARDEAIEGERASPTIG